MSRRVLFVCTGNTCRSPLAEAFARVAVRRRRLSRVVFESAGTYAAAGAPPSELALRVGARRGADLSSHRARRLDRSTLAAADWVLAMTRSHLETVRALDSSVPASLITEVLPEGHPAFGRDVPDPLGGDEEVYENVAELLEESVAHLLDRLGEPESPIRGGNAES